jgi:hypothetical protein
MPPIPSKQSSAAPTALIYITLGALMAIWSGLWFLYNNNNNGSRGVNYVCAGLLLTGIAFLVIGFGLGKISRKAQEGELVAQNQAARAAAIANDPAAQP